MLKSHYSNTRKLSLLAGLLLVLGLVSACGDSTPTSGPVNANPQTTSSSSSSNSGGKESLEIWIVDWNADTQTLFKDKLLPAFAKRYPNLSVNVVWKDWQTYDTDIATAFASGTAPDILQYGAEYAWQVATKKQAISLDDRLASWDGAKDFVASAMEATRWQGKTYGLPYLTAPRTYYYRGDLLQAKGISTTPPVTWEDFMANIAPKDTIEGGKIVQQAFPVYNTLLWHEFIEFLYAAGGQMFSPDCKISFNSPAGQVAAQFMVDRYQAVLPKGLVSLPETTISQFAQGTMLSVYGNPNQGPKALAQNAPDKLAQLIVGDPIVPGNVTYKTAGPIQPKTLVFTDWLAISAQSKKVESAWNLLTFLMEPQNLYDYNETQYFFPPRKSAQNLGAYMKEPANQKMVDLFDKYGMAFPSFPETGRFRQILMDQLLAAMNGQISAQTALTNVATQYQPILDKSNFCAKA
jgi:ABC-type glycerol-3-phosphate transport system substrate-binding protein